MPDDENEKKPDHNQEQEFEEWDREHREPIISPDAEEILRNEMRFDRIAREALKAFYDKHRQEAFAEKRDVINAELDAEFGARGGREKDAAIIPPQSIEPHPKPAPADIKPLATVVEINKAATTPKDPAPAPPAPEIPEQSPQQESMKVSSPEKPATENAVVDNRKTEIENPAVEPEKEETATWSPETKEWHATLAGPVVEGPIGDVQVDASSAAEFEPAADPEDEVSETESESAGEASKRKADPEQLLAQRRELKRKLKDGKGLTKQEAAIYYNKTTRTIFDWCKTDGPLKVVKPRGRITAKSILDFPPEDDIDGPE
jgi:hypothetical protein